MRTNKELQKMLVEKTEHYRDAIPVFKIRNTNAKELRDESIKLILPFTDVEQTKDLRFDCKANDNYTRIQLQDDATLHYFHASGFKLFQKNTNPFSKLVSSNAEQDNTSSFKERACDVLEKNRLNIADSFEQLKFERLWQLKASGINTDKQQTATVINRLVYAYRRYVNEIPVWGRASVFVKTAADFELDAFGIDWRRIHDAPLTVAQIISPEDAAARALEQLQNTNPEKIFTPNDFNPESFSLGYFSNTKTMHQAVLQPVYVAKFIPMGLSKMGHVVVVPAAGTAYESLCRKSTAPPLTFARSRSNITTDTNTQPPTYKGCRQ